MWEVLVMSVNNRAIKQCNSKELLESSVVRSFSSFKAFLKLVLKHVGKKE